MDAEKKLVKILLVDDEELVVQMYERIFTKGNGYLLETAKDGQEGLEKIKETKPDLVLLDILMPKIHGIDVLQLMKKDDTIARIPVLILTNLDEPGRMDQALSLGAQGYLVKSNYKPDEVMAKVEDILKQFKKI